jgi:hypothetical protein
MADAKKEVKSNAAYKGDYLDDTERETAGCSVMISYARKGKAVCTIAGGREQEMKRGERRFGRLPPV